MRVAFVDIRTEKKRLVGIASRIKASAFDIIAIAAKNHIPSYELQLGLRDTLSQSAVRRRVCYDEPILTTSCLSITSD